MDTNRLFNNPLSFLLQSVLFHTKLIVQVGKALQIYIQSPLLSLCHLSVKQRTTIYLFEPIIVLKYLDSSYSPSQVRYQKIDHMNSLYTRTSFLESCQERCPLFLENQQNLYEGGVYQECQVSQHQQDLYQQDLYQETYDPLIYQQYQTQQDQYPESNNITTSYPSFRFLEEQTQNQEQNQETISMLISLLNEKDSQLKAANDIINEKESLLKAANDIINEKESLLKGANAIINEKESQLKDANAIINEKDTQLKVANAIINEKESQLKDAHYYNKFLESLQNPPSFPEIKKKTIRKPIAYALEVKLEKNHANIVVRIKRSKKTALI
ncbi:20289_t:CDS:2 [Cetraspora pellucida]|uniref:20289_t:CDS:1 n=1 Tax=Cetraspora pellucida TaxID=1433469 RepID=A0A9N9AZ81_9GLOM|nr:20289_t:CDS:2 [Cetraspora pellucida]